MILGNIYPIYRSHLDRLGPRAVNYENTKLASGVMRSSQRGYSEDGDLRPIIIVRGYSVVNTS
jgi:hypothetical protein